MMTAIPEDAGSESRPKKARGIGSESRPTKDVGLAPSTLAELERAFQVEQQLSEDLAAVNPFALLQAWMGQAQSERRTPNPESMALATVGPSGQPSCRIVLCRAIDAEAGFVVFYTNRLSRKGGEIAAGGRAAATFHFDHLDRQVRLEGQILPTPEADSDAYFARRGTLKALAAWASEQSQPLGSRSELLDRLREVIDRFGIDDNSIEGVAIPRPPHWGGQRLWAEAIELWVGNPSRLHDRAVWRRELGEPAGPHDFSPGVWSATRLQP